MRTLNKKDLEELQQQFRQDVKNWRGEEPPEELLSLMGRHVDPENKESNLRFAPLERGFKDWFPDHEKFISSVFMTQRALAKELLYD